MTPKKRTSKKSEVYSKGFNNNQSTADLTENNNNKNNIFNNISNSSKLKEISLKLNMNDI